MVAALFEGVSFVFILLALSSLTDKNELDLSGYPLVSKIESLSLFSSGSSEKLLLVFFTAAVLSQIIRSSLTYFAKVTTSIISLGVQCSAQKSIYDQILSFSFSQVSRYKVGDLVNYANIPVTFTSAALASANTLIVSAFTVITLFATMMFLSPSLTLMSIGIFGVFGITQKLILRRLGAHSHQLSDQIAEFNQHSVQNLHGLRLIHSFHRQKFMSRKIIDSIHSIADFTKKMAFLNQLIPFCSEVAGVFLAGFFLIVGHTLLSGTRPDVIPLLLTFITVIYRLNVRVQGVYESLSIFATSWGQLNRMNTLLKDEDKEFIRSGGNVYFTPKKKIYFDDVSLLYTDTFSPSLDSISFSIPIGKTIAFVGKSGAGKSSIMDLLLRLYYPTTGKILVDGLDLEEFGLQAWRDSLGVVSQDSFIFNETIRNNVTFGKLDATDEEIINASKKAGAHEFIVNCPRGYDTVIGERGYRISGGERQRLSLARALVRNPDILILDEATSCLDSHSEKLIQESILSLHSLKTIIIVAHRLSTVVDADLIYVLDKGKIVESGSHFELLEKSGAYHSLWEIQTNKAEELVID